MKSLTIALFAALSTLSAHAADPRLVRVCLATEAGYRIEQFESDDWKNAHSIVIKEGDQATGKVVHQAELTEVSLQTRPDVRLPENTKFFFDIMEDTGGAEVYRITGKFYRNRPSHAQGPHAYSTVIEIEDAGIRIDEELSCNDVE